MNNIAEVSQAELSAVSAGLTWTGLQPGYKLSDDNAGLLLSYCGGLASAAVWVATDVGVWKRNQLRRLYTVGSDQYNEAVGLLYQELSEYMPLSDTTWRAYINVGSAVAYADRVEGYGPATYIPAMTLPPDAFESYLLAVKEGEHKTFLAQLYGKHDKRIASTVTAANGYGPHEDSDDIPFSASAPGVQAEAPEWVAEYENESNDDPPVLTREQWERFQLLVLAVLEERQTDATWLAEKLEWVITYKANY